MNLFRFFLILLCWVCAGPSNGATTDDTYVLRANDVINLNVYGESDLSGDVRILKTGQASFPLIGTVEVANLSVAKAAEKIRELYARDYLVDPKLTLTVNEYATDYVSVIGAVKSPGQIPIPVSGNLDLGSALATAGGVTETADTNVIQLVRASGTTSNFSLVAVKGPTGRTRLFSGDRIIVNESRFINQSVSILGHVAKSGNIPFPVDGKLDLITAISLAGGITELGNSRKLSINRKGNVQTVNFKEISQKGSGQFLLQPGDIITVPERIF